MATRKRHSPEQVVRKLMTADRLLGEGKYTAVVGRVFLGLLAQVCPPFLSFFGRNCRFLLGVLSGLPRRLIALIPLSVTHQPREHASHRF